MKACIIYHPNAEGSRLAEEYAADFKRTRNANIELVDVDGQDGARMAELYGIMTYPTLLVIRDNGELVQSWETTLPLANELAGYLNS